MKKLLIILAVFAVLMPVWGAEAAEVTNVALNADVTLHNGPFFKGGWCCGKLADPGTIVDGIFFGRSHQWDQGPVWWDARRSSYPGKQHIIIDLGAIYTIESFIVQADDNDGYSLYYWNLDSNAWEIAWQIWVAGGWGMQTRPNRLDNTQRYMLPSSIDTNALLFKGRGGDLYYSVSEIQAFGYPAVINVAIDIKPGSFPNSINPRSGGVVPVAILSTEDFDATSVNPLSVRFGSEGAYEAHDDGHAEDVNGDGYLDLVLHFRTQETGIACGQGEAWVTGVTFDGFDIEGSDSVRMSGCR